LFRHLDARAETSRGIGLEGNEGTAYGAAAVSTAQAVGDETQNETPRPARTLEQPPHARYDELSDGITVAQVTAVWSRSPATVCPTEAGLICSVTPSIFPGCPSCQDIHRRKQISRRRSITALMSTPVRTSNDGCARRSMRRGS